MGVLAKMVTYKQPPVNWQACSMEGRNRSRDTLLEPPRRRCFDPNIYR